MNDTAEIVAKRYGITREDQDAYALLSQQRTAAAQAAQRFDDEIISLKTLRRFHDEDGKSCFEEVELAQDEGNRPTTTLERSEEHTSELQSLMRISYAVFCLKKKTIIYHSNTIITE